jgi:tRNA 5-methylaminomethyl-2-thiouridine biosynthesis bifunctional protein
MQTTPAQLPRTDSLANAQQVFLDGTRIVERWKGRERFVVLDTHFDLGLHFLATWHAWRTDPQRPTQLHYVAIDSRACPASPLLQLQAQSWPELLSLSQELVAKWPTAVPGFHRILLSNEGVVLTLVLGDVEKSLPRIDAQVDAFYLSRSDADQYSEHSLSTFFTVLGRLAAPYAMLAIEAFSVAEAQAVKNTGFVFEEGGFGARAHFAPRWTSRPLPTVCVSERHAIVIGAGLAGSAACERLAARGWQITLIEQHAQAAQEASGNLAGIFMPLLAKDDNPSARLSRSAFLFALRLWQRMGGVGQAFSGEACGVLQLARDAVRASVAQEIAGLDKFPPEFAQWLSAAAASELLGMPALPEAEVSRHGGWLFPQGGWAHPGEVCEALLAACGSRLLRCFSRQALRLERDANQWQVFDDRGNVIARASHVILANGIGARDVSQTADLLLDAVRGQVTYLSANMLPALPLVVCCEGYVTRPFGGVCSVGASYDADNDPHLRSASQRDNLARLDHMLPGVSSMQAELPLAGRVGFRCVSADRLPLVGALPDRDAMANFRGDRLREVPRLPGLYGLLGYASRGLIWAPLAAELLAAKIAGEPLPIERELAAALDPARFCLSMHRRTGKIR